MSEWLPIPIIFLAWLVIMDRVTLRILPRAMDSHYEYAHPRVRFHESAASGWNLPYLGRHVNANGCLSVSVEGDTIRVRVDLLYRPFNFLYRMEHRFSGRDILAVTEGEWVLRRGSVISYRDEQGEIRTFEIFLRRREEFLAALRAFSHAPGLVPLQQAPM
jgi:hypothetical protein